MSQHDLGKYVTDSLEQYFRDLDGEKPTAIYDMVLKSIEKPMLEVVLAKAGNNQTAAADMLGTVSYTHLDVYKRQTHSTVSDRSAPQPRAGSARTWSRPPPG